MAKKTDKSTNKYKYIKDGATRTNIDVFPDTKRKLTIEALKKGFNSFKTYAEHLLEEKAAKIKI